MRGIPRGKNRMHYSGILLLMWQQKLYQRLPDVHRLGFMPEGPIRTHYIWRMDLIRLIHLVSVLTWVELFVPKSMMEKKIWKGCSDY